MGSQPDRKDEILLNDDLGRMIQKSLEMRVVRMAPPARGREMLLAAARTQQINRDDARTSGQEELRWVPPQRRDQGHSDHDVWSALIHARDSVRRMSL